MSREALQALLDAAARIVAEHDAPLVAPGIAPSAEAPEWMPIGKFAKRHGYAERTVSRWVRLGMPHVGRGRNCRINVSKARAWISEDGAKKAVLQLGQAAHLRSMQ
jgi:hypothetical protein